MLRFAPRALLLDLDGLMVDSEPLWLRVERDFALERCGRWSDDLAARCVGHGIAATLGVLGAALGFAVEPERDARTLVDSFLERVAELELKPGCAELLRDAHGKVGLAVASSSPLRLIEAVVGRFGLCPVFDHLVSGETVPRPKPAPDVFLEAARRLAVAPGSCLVLEDSFAGATAGRAAGMWVVAVPEGGAAGRGFEAVADAVVADLHEARLHIEL